MANEGVGVDGVADSHRDRAGHEMSVLRSVVVVAVAINVVLDVDVATPAGVPVGIRVGTIAVLDDRHHARGGGVDTVTFITVEVEARVCGGNSAAITVIPGAAVDLHVVVVDRQDKGTVGEGLGVGQEEAQDHEDQDEQRLAHGSVLW